MDNEVKKLVYFRLEFSLGHDRSFSLQVKVLGCFFDNLNILNLYLHGKWVFLAAPVFLRYD